MEQNEEDGVSADEQQREALARELTGLTGWRQATVRASELEQQLASIQGSRAGSDAGQAGAEQAEGTPVGKPKRRAGKIVALALVAVLVVAAGALTGWMYVEDAERVQHVPEHTTLDGEVDVSGITRDELADVVEKRGELGYSQTLDIKINGEDNVVKLTQIGDLDAAATVDEAFAPYAGAGFLERGVRQLQGLFTELPEQSYDVQSVVNVKQDALADYVKQLAKKLNTDAVDAGYEYNSKKGTLVAVKPKPGIKVDQKATCEAVTTALEGATGDIEVDGVAKVTKPKQEKSGQAIFVDTYGCHLYLYENGKVVFDCACSPGQAGYLTPQGDWYLEYKDPSPTWYNPHAAWSADMPDVWEPGYDNPLGVRALAVSCGDGIFIHGTINVGALGSRDSHGCVRLSNDNIVTLYNMVSVGIPIIIR